MKRMRDDDACPGALQVHQAADGALARVRLPGGMITAAQLEALAHVATEFGNGTLELTARGNLQLRAVRDTAVVAEAVAAAGLLPSPTHERVRNIVASPLSGRVGGLADVRSWVAELDAALQADPDLARLPGRFLFGIDDGRGDISGLGADVGAHVLDEGVTLLLAGRDTGIRLPPGDVVTALATVARRFVTIRGKAWRIAELNDPSALVSDFPATASAGATYPPVPRPPVGWIAQEDGRVTLGAAIPLGVLAARQAEFVAAIDAPVVITPWRSLLICELTEAVADTSLRVLAPMGLVFDENSPWLDVSACVGSPGCDKSLADVRAEATRVATGDVDGPAGGHVHYVGCERACGSPPAGRVLVATAEGFYERKPGVVG
ncbi:precorrin-3B synthase [Mycobacterium sp. CVI_P3]|uniref:Precorrin-3B synthase n=1 Tax=Mycobacterium pinniadriaticum TaxID=2994102 RepID=A0ABT3SBT4_9MYCO|nr:precorrin-3B synthase [Mycobacterium pinniadriaticum]MCX2930355.1 precorrin-3B synthase [Mycobacterium pinniadriaticum]MCX2936583.1 precorrin-3B synthase [Mycobacterium pinniadriaticum]